MSDLISVIIPAYNSEETLGPCLASIFRQTYSNLEIILIDDCSTDATPQMCDAFAKENTFVKVIHLTKNGGPSNARNTGLTLASGKYISFIDSDDEILPTYFETLLEIAKGYDSDISAVSFQIIKRDKTPKQVSDRTNIVSYDKESAINDLLYQKNLDSSQCCKLFKREVLENISFPEQYRVYEDLLFIYKAICQSQKVCWTNRKLYIYHKQANGQMDSVSPKTTDAFEVMDEIKTDILEHHSDLVGAIDNRTISVSFNILKLIYRSGNRNEVIENICWENIRHLRRANFCDPNVRLKNKIGILISLFGANFTRLFFSINK